MSKYEVSFLGGESRNSSEAVNYMIADVDGVELYSEIVLPDDEDEDYGYDELKGEILQQAQDAGIAADDLKFWYD